MLPSRTHLTITIQLQKSEHLPLSMIWYNSLRQFIILVNNYSPKWRWLAMDIYRAAQRRGKYPPLATDTEVNSCFSIY